VTDLLWYAAYGSNLSRDRFACYVQGGTPVGAHHRYVGCRDRTPPAATAPMRITGRLTFAGESTIWGGGLAYLDPEAADGEVVARGYLITDEQLEDVAAQEPRYDRVAEVGRYDGVRVVALASTQTHPAAPPSAPYLRTILTGLTDGLLDAEAAIAYLLAVPGIELHWDDESIRRLRNSRPRGRVDPT
jgi:hypothetical protein